MMAKQGLCDGLDCGNEKPIRVSFCPKCKSRDVKYVFGFGNLFGVIPKMRCSNCGSEDSTFPILVTNKKLLLASAKLKKNKTRNIKGVKKIKGRTKK